MALDPTTFERTIIAPVLKKLDLFSAEAQQLLLGTAIQESQLTHRRQIGGGPALGLYQMEPETHDDIWNNYLKFRKPLAKKIEALLSGKVRDKAKELENNDSYATAMARVQYARALAPLPPLNDIEAMARYWKLHYNTPLGAGSPDDFINNWNKAMGVTLGGSKPT